MQSTPFRRIRTLAVDGRTYAIHPLSVDDLMVDLQAWVDRQFPDPFDVVNAQIEKGRAVLEPDGSESREPYPMAVQQFMIRAAIESANAGRKLIGTPEADAKCQSAAGVAELLYLSIRKGDPSFTREQAVGLFRVLSVAQVAAIFEATNADLVLSDPKAPGADGTETP